MPNMALLGCQVNEDNYPSFWINCFMERIKEISLKDFFFFLAPTLHLASHLRTRKSKTTKIGVLGPIM